MKNQETKKTPDFFVLCKFVITFEWRSFSKASSTLVLKSDDNLLVIGSLSNVPFINGAFTYVVYIQNR